MARLRRMPHIRRVAAQTNLSWPTGWLDGCDLERIAFWCTFHPGETRLDRFLGRCAELDARGISYSVGIVGKREHFDALAALRRALRPEIYLWVNAYRDEGRAITGRTTSNAYALSIRCPTSTAPESAAGAGPAPRARVWSASMATSAAATSFRPGSATSTTWISMLP